MAEFFRFPQTPHVLWLGDGEPRGDKLLEAAEVEQLLSGPVVVEEKVDGANVGISVSEDGQLLVQNRGTYLRPGECHVQFRDLFTWLSRGERDLIDMLSPSLMLFGEWCFAVHSIPYDRLPDWFLAFDVYDRAEGRFWSTVRRNELVELLDIATVPLVARGQFSVDELKQLLDTTPSAVRDGPSEGIYIRREDGDWLLMRAKLVRADFTQAIEEHWSRAPIRRNRLASGASWV